MRSCRGRWKGCKALSITCAASARSHGLQKALEPRILRVGSQTIQSRPSSPSEYSITIQQWWISVSACSRPKAPKSDSVAIHAITKPVARDQRGCESVFRASATTRVCRVPICKPAANTFPSLLGWHRLQACPRSECPTASLRPDLYFRADLIRSCFHSGDMNWGACRAEEAALAC